jgi:hypothetical protein
MAFGVASLGAGLACSSDDSGDDSNGNDGGTAGDEGGAGGTSSGDSGATSEGGTSGEANASGSGGTSEGGEGGEATGGTETGGTGGVEAGGAGGESGGEGGAGGTAAIYEGPFTCTEFIGAYMSMEWWGQGFEDKLAAKGVAGASGDTWQLKWHHHGYIQAWGDPNNPFWLDQGDPNDDAQGAPIQSPCVENSAAPDRIVFFAIDWEIEDEAGWITELNNDIAAIKLKRPSAKRIDIMPLVRCPGNTMCNPNADYGPGANPVAGRQDCYVPPFVDSAIAAVIAQHPEIVAAGPVIEAPACRQPIDGAHLSNEGNQYVAQQMADFYAARP